MVLPIVLYGNKVLRQECKKLEANSDELQSLIENMFETMENAMGVGLAAPQIGKALRLFVIDSGPMHDEKEQKKAFREVFINPEMIDESGSAFKYEEGCLSIPAIRENVWRKPSITIEYLDRDFKKQTKSFDGMNARVIQHEYDHIEGILFTDHLKPITKRLVKNKLKDIQQGKVRADYPVKR